MRYLIDFGRTRIALVEQHTAPDERRYVYRVIRRAPTEKGWLRLERALGAKKWVEMQ